MEFIGFSYEIKAKVTFTRTECHDLVALAKTHYDAVCVEAALLRGEKHPKVGVARANGFLAQLIMFSKPLDKEVRATWPFAHFDTTLKILEQRGMLRHTASAARMSRYADLWRKMREVCDKINAEWNRLSGARRVVPPKDTMPSALFDFLCSLDTADAQEAHEWFDEHAKTAASECKAVIDESRVTDSTGATY